MNAYEKYLAGCERLENGDYRGAVRLLSESCRKEPHFKTLEWLYRCYIALGERDKAFQCIENAYRLNPRNDLTALEYARMITESDTGKARTVLVGILARNPSYKPAEMMLNELGG